MPALQVRDLPPQVYEDLKTCAEEEHRSIAQQALVAIEDYLARRKREKEVQAVVDAGIPPVPKPWEPGYRDWQRSQAAAQARLERRREVFARIDALPISKDPEGFPSVAELIREDMDSR